MFYLTMHSTDFIYGYNGSYIWLRTILIVREETRCRHMGYSFQLAARVDSYASSHRQDNTYHDLCYTSRAALARTRNSLMKDLSIKRQLFIIKEYSVVKYQALNVKPRKLLTAFMKLIFQASQKLFTICQKVPV